MSNDPKLGRRRKFLQQAIVSATALGTTSLTGASASSPVAAADGKRESASIPRRQLGVTGVGVPILHLGTAQTLDPVYDKVMHRCFKDGVTWFDTALSYGWGASHRAVANFIQQMGDRKKLWLTSKSGSRQPRGLIASIDEALDELQVDYLDLYLMHGINHVDMLERPFIEAGERLRKSGKTRFFGFSCHAGNVVALLNKAAQVGGIDAILFRYNFRRYGDRELNLAIDNCKKAGIGLLAMKTMGSVPADIEAVTRFRSENFTLAQAKLKSVWADERIDSLVSEMDSVRVVRENIAAAKSEVPLTAEESHQLNQLAALTARYACNGCSHLCEAALPGPAAIEAPLRYLMYYECYGKTERARELYSSIPPAARQWNAAALQRAAAVCPQGIDIRDRLERAQSVLAV